MRNILEKPVQIRLPGLLREKITRIAAVNHLSEADVIRLCLSQAVPAIEENGLTIFPSAKPKRKSA
jgi:hypothetical protein